MNVITLILHCYCVKKINKKEFKKKIKRIAVIPFGETVQLGEQAT